MRPPDKNAYTIVLPALEQEIKRNAAYRKNKDLVDHFTESETGRRNLSLEPQSMRSSGHLFSTILQLQPHDFDDYSGSPLKTINLSSNIFVKKSLSGFQNQLGSRIVKSIPRARPEDTRKPNTHQVSYRRITVKLDPRCRVSTLNQQSALPL